MILWREFKRYKKSRSGLIVKLIQPAIWIIVVGNTFAGTESLISAVGFEGSYIEFMAPGIIILTAIFTSIAGGSGTLWDRRFGFINRALISPASRLSIAFGKISAISLIATLQSSIVLGIAIAIGAAFPDLLVIISVLATVILFSFGFAGISVLIATISKSYETFGAVINFLSMPLFILSPALFPLELLPEWLASVAKLNPVTYAVLMVRELMTGVSEAGISIAFNITMIGLFALIMVGIATFAFTREIKKPI